MDMVAEISLFILSSLQIAISILAIISAVLGSIYLYFLFGLLIGPPFVRLMNGQAAAAKSTTTENREACLLVSGTVLMPALLVEAVGKALTPRQYVQVNTGPGSFHMEPRMSIAQEAALFGARVLLVAFFMLVVLGAVGRIFGPAKQPVKAAAAPLDETGKENGKSG